MKSILSLTLLSSLLLAVSGCVDDEVTYSRRPHVRASHYDDRQTTTHYRTRPVYRDDRSVYRTTRSVHGNDVSTFRGDRYQDDGYEDRRDVRVYNAAPTVRRTQVRVGY